MSYGISPKGYHSLLWRSIQILRHAQYIGNRYIGRGNSAMRFCNLIGDSSMLQSLTIRESALSCIAALRGNGTAFDIIRDHATRGPVELETLARTVADIFNAERGAKPGTGLDASVRAKCPGAAKFVPYLALFRKLAKGYETEAGQLKIAAARTADAFPKAARTADAFPKAAPIDATADKVKVTRTFTADDAIAALEAFHAAGSLTAGHYAALQVMIGTFAARPVDASVTMQ